MTSTAVDAPETTTAQRRRILLYGDINLNIMDGSAVWLVSMAEALSRTHSEVWVLLKSPLRDDRLTRQVRELPNVHLVQPFNLPEESAELSPRYAIQAILALDDEHHFNIVITRGLAVAQALAGCASLLERAWIYITDIPFPASKVSEKQLLSLNAIARGARKLFAQTENARSYLESLVPQAASKTLLLPPMIPDNLFKSPPTAGKEDDGILHLIYAGKFAKDWHTLEMCSIVPLLEEEGIQSGLTMVGDKFQDDRSDPSWPDRMREALAFDGVDWAGGMPRDDALNLIRKHDVGLSWRSAKLNASLELSTKALEYAAAGVPPILNRTIAHEELFGADYPFFVDGDSLGSLVAVLRNSRAALAVAREKAWVAAQPFSIGQSARRLEAAFVRAHLGGTAAPGADGPLKVAFAGHDFKFAGELLETLRSHPAVLLRIDRWTTLHTHDLAQSEDMVEWADIVICEWAGPNSVWYSEHKKPGQALIVRLHAFELRGPWLPKLKISAVDRIVCVSGHYKQLTQQKLGIAAKKVVVIPNSLDCEDLRRAKVPGFHHRLGMIGIVPFLKRPDRALDVLEALLAQDSRFSLHIKGRMPWEYSYEWAKPVQQEAYREFFRRIGASSILTDRVVFEPFASDMGSWLRKIGFVLSPSTQESFHLAPAEGMATGAPPVIWDRPGAVEVFGPEFAVASNDAAVEMISHLAGDLTAYRDASELALKKAATFDITQSSKRWMRQILAFQETSSRS